MQPLNLPPYPFRLKRVNGEVHIFDELRSKWLVCAPEEWVRQHLVMYLIHHKGYAKGRIGIEHALTLSGITRRADIVTFDAAGNPQLLVECKAPKIKLTEACLTRPCSTTKCSACRIWRCPTDWSTIAAPGSTAKWLSLIHI